MIRGIIWKIFVVVCVTSVRAQNDLGDCRIRVVELNDMQVKLSSAVDLSGNVDFVSDCALLTRNLISLTSRKRNMLKKRKAEVKRVYDEKEAELVNQQNKMLKPLRELPDQLRDEYKEAYEFLGAAVKKIRTNTDSELKLQAAIRTGIGFYELYPSLSSESNDSSCSLSDNNGQLISNMQEIYSLLTGTNFTGQCKVLVNKMTNIEAFEDNSFKYEERKLELLNKTFTERFRFVNLLLVDNEQSLRDFGTIKQDKFDELTFFQGQIVKRNEELTKERVKAAGDFAIKMLQEGIRFDDVKIAIEDAKNDLQNALKYILETAYTCKPKYLSNIIRFTRSYSWTGFPIIFEKMKTCDQLDDPLILKIAKLHDGNDIEQHVEKVYEKLANDVRSDRTDSVVALVKDLTTKDIDAEKIVRKSYDKNSENFLLVTKFIEKLGTVPQKLEEVLYDEMIKSGHSDTTEHIMFAVFIKKMIAQARKNVDEPRFQSLESIRRRLPEGIRNLCFSEAIYFMAEDSSSYGKPYGYKVTTFNGGRYLQFQEANDRGLFLYAGFSNLENMPAHGKLTKHDAFLWNLKPTENGKYFHVSNKANKFFLNTIEHHNCEKYSWFGLGEKCTQWSTHYFLSSPQEPAQKLIIKEA